MHGGGPPVSAGKPLAREYTEEDIPLVRAGCCNLAKHIENARKFGVEVVVAVNQFKSDTDAEMEAVREASLAAGAFDAVVANHWAEGGRGAEALGRAVIAACEASDVGNFRFLYDLALPIRAKVETISREIYGADGVDFSELAEQQMAQYESSGFGTLPSEIVFFPICDGLPLVSISLLTIDCQKFSLYCKDAVLVQLRPQGQGGADWFSHLRTGDSQLRWGWILVPHL